MKLIRILGGPCPFAIGNRILVIAFTSSLRINDTLLRGYAVKKLSGRPIIITQYDCNYQWLPLLQETRALTAPLLMLVTSVLFESEEHTGQSQSTFYFRKRFCEAVTITP